MTRRIFTLVIGSAFLGLSAFAQTPVSPSAVTTSPLLPSSVFEWDKLKVTPTKLGERRAVFDGQTATVDNVHCHITTLNPGEQSGEPRLHLVDEIIIIKEGAVEVFMDGEKRPAPTGSVVFFAANAVTALRNTGYQPATYYVISYVTPLTPKQ